MNDPSDKFRVYLKPGEIFLGSRPAVVTTVLGSCVSATIFHPSGVSGICHAVQPRCPEAAHCAGDCPDSGRFVACAMGKLIRRVAAHGLSAREIEVKLFGGASMVIPHEPPRSTPECMGRLNVICAMEMIRGHGLKLKASDVGGAFGRKLMFHTRTGEVFLKRLMGDAAVRPNLRSQTAAAK